MHLEAETGPVGSGVAAYYNGRLVVANLPDANERRRCCPYVYYQVAEGDKGVEALTLGAGPLSLSDSDQIENPVHSKQRGKPRERSQDLDGGLRATALEDFLKDLVSELDGGPDVYRSRRPLATNYYGSNTTAPDMNIKH